MKREQQRRLDAPGNPAPAPHEVIARIARSYANRSDEEILTAIRLLPELLDETAPEWASEEYWNSAVFPFMALSDIAGERKLLPAIRLLLDRACFGDPGEFMRGLRHSFERIVNPNWSVLADICITASVSQRLGTKLWALNQLAILDDARAKPIFELAVNDGPDEIRWIANLGLDRLTRMKG